MSQSRGLRRVVAIVIRVSGATSANGMARPCSYHRRRESDGNQHMSAIDPCQSTPDDSSVLISIPLMLTPPTGSGASLMRSGGQYGQARAPANLAGTIMISWKHAAEPTRAITAAMPTPRSADAWSRA